jgi:AraC-like DNA-binding protein
MAALFLPRLSSKGAPITARRARIASAGVVSESVLRAPDPRLEQIIVGEYQGWTESSTEVVRRREVPICAFPLIINFGAPFRLVDPARPVNGPRILGTFAAGMYDSYVIVESSGDSCCIQVNFTPIGARLFFQLPLSELSNRSLGLDELYGDQAGRVVEALAEGGDWDRRFDLLDALIAERISRARSPRPEIQWAWGKLQATNGKLEIGDLAEELGWSHRHLIVQFRDQLGTAPKRLGRVLRFQRTIERIRACDAPRWVELALDCGYFDQSHMIREFRELAGCTPEDFVRLQLPIGGVSAGQGAGEGNSGLR